MTTRTIVGRSFPLVGISLPESVDSGVGVADSVDIIVGVGVSGPDVVGSPNTCVPLLKI